MKRTVWIGVAFAVAVLCVLVYSTLGLRRYRVEVCMEHGGRTSCRTASAATRAQAQRSATENACAEIASGMAESINCENSRPVSVKWKD